MPQDVTQAVHEFIVSNFLYGQERELHDDDSFMGEGIIDSTGVLQLVAFIEETFGVVVEDDELVPENLDSMRNVTAYVHRKLSN